MDTRTRARARKRAACLFYPTGAGESHHLDGCSRPPSVHRRFTSGSRGRVKLAAALAAGATSTRTSASATDSPPSVHRLFTRPLRPGNRLALRRWDAPPRPET